MKSIVHEMQKLPRFRAASGASPEQIEEAERALGLQFADEYKAYLAAFGFASANGHELTGISKSPRLNVVEVTRAERVLNPTAPKDLYVIEQANIDGIVVWQCQVGEVFQTMPNMPIIRLCGSLAEYLEM